MVVAMDVATGVDVGMALSLELTQTNIGRPIVALPQIFTLGPGKPRMPGYKAFQGFCS